MSGEQGEAQHPVEEPTLPIYMGLLLALSFGAFYSNGTVGMVFAAILSGALFACFLVLFAVYCCGYLLRGHALWQEERRQRAGQ